MNEEDTEFLTWCARENDLLIEGVTKEDISFIKECIDSFNKEKEENRPKNNRNDEDSWSEWKEFYFAYEEPGILFDYINEELDKRDKQKKLKLEK